MYTQICAYVCMNMLGKENLKMQIQFDAYVLLCRAFRYVC